MEITKAELEKQVVELEGQSQMAFANYHRAQAVLLLLKNQIKQLDTPAPEPAATPEPAEK